MEENDADVLVRFEVRDTGIGIAPERLGSLFTAFEQADSSTTRRFGGTGLGLVITRQLAFIMGGDAGARSTVGVGSAFWFTARLSHAAGDSRSAHRAAQSGTHAPLVDDLPNVHKRPDTADEPVPPPIQRLRRAQRGARLLVAEDNVVNQQVAVELLRSAGLEVEVASNGREAVERLRSETFDLVLMDLQMPELDGLHATRALRRLANGASVPVIAMTANVFGEDREACFAAGMNDHIAKPVDPDVLYETVLRWLPARPSAPLPSP